MIFVEPPPSGRRAPRAAPRAAAKRAAITMRLLTYNIHKGIGGRDGRYDLERVCRVIEEQGADLICLQEVTQNARRTHHHDQPRLLAERLGANALLFQMNVHYREGGYGNLVL